MIFLGRQWKNPGRFFFGFQGTQAEIPRFFEQSFVSGEKNPPPQERIENSTPNPCAPLLPGGHQFQGNATQASWAFFRGIGACKKLHGSRLDISHPKMGGIFHDPPVVEKKKTQVNLVVTAKRWSLAQGKRRSQPTRQKLGPKQADQGKPQMVNRA